jgi:hypothetical protein
VARKHVADLLFVRRGYVPQKMRHRAQYTWRAETALQGMMLREGALYLVERAWLSKALNGYDIRTVCLSGVLGAAAHRSPVD